MRRGRGRGVEGAGCIISLVPPHHHGLRPAGLCFPYPFPCIFSIAFLEVEAKFT